MNRTGNWQLLGAVFALAISNGASAVPFVINAQLLGDIRAANPDGLIVDVTIAGDDMSNTTMWTVDINSPLHPNIKLDEFYFNLSVNAADVSFANFTPAGWAANSPASVQGAGGTAFTFEILDPAGPPNALDVTNSLNLTFDAILNTGNWSTSIFTNADIAMSNDAGSGQLGAHLQSLTLGNPGDPATSDSGFAFGNYVVTGDTPSVPEPAVYAMLGMGVLMLGATGLRRRRAKSQ